MEAENSPRTIIAGKFHYPTDTLKTSFAISRLLQDRKEVPITTNEDGTFQFDLDIDQFSNSYLIGQSWTSLLIQPSDSLYIDVYENDSVVFSGNGSEINNLSLAYKSELDTLTGLTKEIWNYCNIEYTRIR